MSIRDEAMIAWGSRLVRFFLRDHEYKAGGKCECPCCQEIREYLEVVGERVERDVILVRA